MCKREDPFGPVQVMVHEGVETRGRRAVMTKLENIRDLQSALGANQMIIDGLEMQLQKVSPRFRC